MTAWGIRGYKLPEQMIKGEKESFHSLFSLAGAKCQPTCRFYKQYWNEFLGNY